ncbi:MarR family transcriptional regulator [Leucobacter rhizosphaerae]|uniref:MarR family transcriptional regulator n=1 Tax=Leucobacter rhizosphaerae TaxID=2932245 RepID=A0ABY4FSZ9_9MICO|nr:MarR family transcriptional regulator [Leucobacter rhizosphaerae]UOQ59417.1 MarR family transcriptional regulator [Leucobacter rhizosphaerae]
MTEAPERSSLSSSLYSLDVNDPMSELIDRSDVDPDVVAHISHLMAALGRLRDAEQQISEASQRYMQLGRTDMRALHFLIIASHSATVTTPSAIAAHLGISSASTTKLLDRLETGGHIRRSPHPTDRRALAITVTESSREAAMQTVGRLQAQRYHAAARLTPEERDVVIRFLTEMTDEITLRDEMWAAVDHGRSAGAR